MANRLLPLAASIVFAGAAFADAPRPNARDQLVCRLEVESPAQCRWIEGRMSIYSGTPPVRIVQRHGRKVYAVGPSEHELMPAELKSKLTVDNAVDARFRVCPFKKAIESGMTRVCVDAVSNAIVVADP